MNLFRLLYCVWTVAGEKHLGLIAAGVGFFGMFAIFPAIAAVIAIFGLVADPAVVSEQLVLLQDVIPTGAYGLFEQQINGLLQARSETLGLATAISILLAVWASRARVAALMGGLNAIEGMPNRNGAKQILVAMLLTICLMMLAITAMIALVILPLVLAYVPLASKTAWLWGALGVSPWCVVLWSKFALSVWSQYATAPQAMDDCWGRDCYSAVDRRFGRSFVLFVELCEL